MKHTRIPKELMLHTSAYYIAMMRNGSIVQIPLGRARKKHSSWEIIKAYKGEEIEEV